MAQDVKHFGTDGIRGKVGGSLINPEFIIKLGWAVGKILGGRKKKKKILIGKDTRISGYMIEAALEAGLSAAGVDIDILGPMPTPAIAYLTKTLRAQAGIVISASHNPYYDNGIKLFSSEGRKLPDDIQVKIEKELKKDLVVVDSNNMGKAARIIDAQGRYIEFCKGTVPAKTSFEGLKIVVDCANGATYHIAPNVFKELGAEVVAIGNTPNGININDNCGSTHIHKLRHEVLKRKAHLGIALDGDGDRVIMIDHKGESVDGDEILYIIAKRKHEAGQLQGGVVGTVMSNMGLEYALKKLGVDFVRTKVGDRYVIAEIIKRKWRLGGESSGHIINYDINETGDGIIAALQVVEAIISLNKSLHELKIGMHKWPQILQNVAVNDAKVILEDDKIQARISHMEKELKNNGRILIRSSGTEPLLRIMVEGKDQKQIEQISKKLLKLIKTKAGC